MHSVPVHRSILAVDIEKSTSALRTNPIKEELRQEVYSMLEASMGVAGINAAHCDPFHDRGDGVWRSSIPWDDVPTGIFPRGGGVGPLITSPAF